MSIRVLLRDHPHRTLALVTNDAALVFRHSHTASHVNDSQDSFHPITPSQASASNPPPQCMVEFASRDTLDPNEYRTVGKAYGTLGLVTLNNDVFLCVVSGASQVATVRPGETVQLIYSVEFHCLNRSDYDHLQGLEANPYPGSKFSSDDVDYGGGFDQGESTAEEPFTALKKLLSNGYFYYSSDFKLTSRLQDRVTDEETFNIATLDEGLLWNSYMIESLLQFRSRLADNERDALDQSRILTSVIRGFVKTITVPPSSAPLRRQVSHLPSTLTIISRLSARRAGTRFNSRGIDDDGNVANFVETETVFWSPAGLCFSYVQIRGSVPIFWESSSSLIPGQQKIQITRSPEATQPAFDKHFERLELIYGGVHVVNLLTETKPGEKELIDRYHYHLERSPLRAGREKGHESEHNFLKETYFDFHVETRGASGYEGARMIRRYIEDSADGFAYFLCEEIRADPKTPTSGKTTMNRPVVVLQQEGVFRTNCLDCLDRTNLVQSMISQMALESFLSHRSETASSDFWVRHSSLWADNGDVLSKIYAGTGALKSSFTRHGKMSLAGAIADARKSAARLYVNNFADKDRQNTIDLLLGRLMGQTPVHLFDPIGDYVTAELQKHVALYSTSQSVYMWVGTFNLNGRGEGLEEDLSPWLCARSAALAREPEIIAIGFQEIVELSPQQIMATDPARRQTWELAVQGTINKHARRQGTDEYVLLRSGQLVGAALMIFVKVSVLPLLRNVEGSIKKTGLSGMAGNKGAVAIRLDYSSTSICFVTAHLAAGFANYEERNRDYRTISHGLHFQKNRAIADHDTIIWLGDFNYRIGLSDERARRLVAARDLETLYENDQLNLQMVAGLAFQYYSEARITFLPTYKFNLNSDEYDTSEKARIPAWTDRILRKGTNLKQIDYDCAPLRFSDHRPVYATFECMITQIDDRKRAEMSKAMYARRREELGTEHAALDRDLDSEEDADLLGYDAVEPGLPPASSDRRKWWLDNGMPSRSNMLPPRSDLIPNPKRPSNPWTKSPNGEPEWISPQNQGLKGKPQPPPPRRRTATPAGERETSQSPSVSAAAKPGNPTLDQSRSPISASLPARHPSNAIQSNLSRTSSQFSGTTDVGSTPQKKAPPKPKKPSSLASPSLDSAPSTNPLSLVTTRPLIPSTASSTSLTRNSSAASRSSTVFRTPSTAFAAGTAAPPPTTNRPARSLPPSASAVPTPFSSYMPTRKDSTHSTTSSSNATFASAHSTNSTALNPPLPPRVQPSTSSPASSPVAPAAWSKIPALPSSSSSSTVTQQQQAQRPLPRQRRSNDRNVGAVDAPDGDDSGPPLPPRRVGTNHGLMDEGIQELGGEVLKPQRRA